MNKSRLTRFHSPSLLLAGLMLASVPSHATVLIFDNFSAIGDTSINGRIVQTGSPAIWTAGTFNTAETVYSGASPNRVVASLDSTNTTRIAVVALPSFTNIMSVSTDVFFSVNVLATSTRPVFVGFSSVTAASVTGNPTTARANTGSAFHGILTNAGLGIQLNKAGSGELQLNGATIAGTTFTPVSGWTLGTQTKVELRYDLSSLVATAFIGSTQVASTTLLSAFTGTYAGFAQATVSSISPQSYDAGNAASRQMATSFDNFTVSSIPEPSSFALLTAGFALALAASRRRRRTV